MRKFRCLLGFLLAFSWPALASKKRVLILYSTGGHATAAKAVEQLLNEHPDEFEVTRHDFAEELDGFARWFYFGGYDLISRHANWINKGGVKMKWTQSDNFSLYSSERFNSQFNQPEKILAYIQKVKPDVIITTHFSLAETLAALREEGHLKNIPIAWTHLDMVSNTFFKQIGDQLDMSFLPTEDMRADWQKVIASNKLMTVGIPIMPEMLRHPERPRSGDPRTTVLLMGGSMGALSYMDIIRQISTAMTKAGRGPLRFIAVCGRNGEMRAKLNDWKEVQVEAVGFVDATTLRKFQSEADLIVSKPGGLTTFELMTSDRPVILTQPIGVQESYNAQYIQQQGAGLYMPQPAGIGDAAVDLLTTTDGRRQIQNQRRVRTNFHLDRIVEWTRHAEVLQPERPAQTVYQRLRPAKADWQWNPVRLCQKLLTVN